MHGKSIVHPTFRSDDRLVRAARSGDERAIAYLITEHPGVCKLVRSLQNKLDRQRIDHDELRAVANLALLDAIRNFDPSRGVKFTTYAYIYVRGAMVKSLYPHKTSTSSNDAGPPIRLVGLDAGAAPDDPDAEGYERELFARDSQYGIDPGYDRAETSDRDAVIASFVGRLVPNQRDIVIDIYWGSKTHQQIASERGVSRPAVSRALARAHKSGLVELAAHHFGLAA
jgi:RNA polymerase sigma factor (sigma-70 family)